MVVRLLPVALISALIVAGCSSSTGTEPPGAAPSSVAPAGSLAAPGQQPPGQDAVTVEGDLSGVRLRLEVEPLQRRSDSTLLQARVTVLEGETNFVDQFSTRTTSYRTTLSDVRLVLPEQELVASPATDAEGAPVASELGKVNLGKGDSAGLQVVFGTLPESVRKVDVLWPILGVVPDVPVGDRPVGALAGYGSAAPRPARGTAATAAVLPVASRTSELAGAVRTDEQPRRTRVAVSADVLFALDSDRLSPAATQALDAAAAQVRATGAGPVRVVGHTDDQGEGAYNEDLSLRRARAVAAALAASLPVDRFPLAVEGRGEREPAVQGTQEQARAANRRVELVAEREQTEAVPPAASPTVPARGPRARGPEGLVLPVNNGSVRLRAVRAVRTGPWLRVELEARIEQSSTQSAGLTIDLRADGSRAVSDATGVGLRDGGRIVLPGVAEDGTCTCPNLVFGIDLKGDDVRPLPVWVQAPERLGTTVEIELPEDLGRLTDVPVI